MPSRTFKVEVEVPKGCKAGDTFELEVEVPTVPKKPRGQLAGIAIEDMTDEQLKREIINAGSVLYKAKQREAAPEIIKKNEDRLEAAKAEKAKRAPVTATVVDENPTITEAIEQDIADADLASEV